MKLSERVDAFVRLGKRMDTLAGEEKANLYARAHAANGWFDSASIDQAIDALVFMLQPDLLTQWTSRYTLAPEVPRIVGVIMAGNIPLVGFHDLLCVLLSGHVAAVKTSAKDDVLMRQIIEWLLEIAPKMKRNIDLRDKLDNVEAVIATGSDNTARYFDYYFSKYPHIIRKNRTSVAVLKGGETETELEALGRDIFWYFGLGCRNVSKVFIPKDFDLKKVFPHWERFADTLHHHKYRNNYDYNKAILLVNGTPHLDTGYLLVQESEALVSPTGVIYFERYADGRALDKALAKHSGKIQCIIGKDFVPFGQAQYPNPWDYADGVDTLQFLDSLQ